MRQPCSILLLLRVVKTILVCSSGALAVSQLQLRKETPGGGDVEKLHPGQGPRQSMLQRSVHEAARAGAGARSDSNKIIRGDRKAVATNAELEYHKESQQLLRNDLSSLVVASSGDVLTKSEAVDEAVVRTGIHISMKNATARTQVLSTALSNASGPAESQSSAGTQAAPVAVGLRRVSHDAAHKAKSRDVAHLVGAVRIPEINDSDLLHLQSQVQSNVSSRSSGSKQAPSAPAPESSAAGAFTPASAPAPPITVANEDTGSLQNQQVQKSGTDTNLILVLLILALLVFILGVGFSIMMSRADVLGNGDRHADRDVGEVRSGFTFWRRSKRSRRGLSLPGLPEDSQSDASRQASDSPSDVGATSKDRPAVFGRSASERREKRAALVPGKQQYVESREKRSSLSRLGAQRSRRDSGEAPSVDEQRDLQRASPDPAGDSGSFYAGHASRASLEGAPGPKQSQQSGSTSGRPDVTESEGSSSDENTYVF